MGSKKSILAGTLMMAISFTQASATNFSGSVPSKAKEQILKAYDDKYHISPDEINETPIKGLYQIVIGNQISYMTGDAGYLIHGSLIDTKVGMDLSDVKRTELERKLPSTFDTSKALKTKKGNGKGVIYIFADPNCGYCKKLAMESEKLNDVTIYTFIVSILGGDSYQKALSIWCAENPETTWNENASGRLSNHKISPTCNKDVINKNTTLFRQLGAAGTPSLFYADGSRQNGYIQSNFIQKRIDDLK